MLWISSVWVVPLSAQINIPPLATAADGVSLHTRSVADRDDADGLLAHSDIIRWASSRAKLGLNSKDPMVRLASASEDAAGKLLVVNATLINRADARAVRTAVLTNIGRQDTVPTDL